jgi:hypothetical protein
MQKTEYPRIIADSSTKQVSFAIGAISAIQGKNQNLRYASAVNAITIKNNSPGSTRPDRNSLATGYVVKKRNGARILTVGLFDVFNPTIIRRSMLSERKIETLI